MRRAGTDLGSSSCKIGCIHDTQDCPLPNQPWPQDGEEEVGSKESVVQVGQGERDLPGGGSWLQTQEEQSQALFGEDSGRRSREEREKGLRKETSPKQRAVRKATLF